MNFMPHIFSRYNKILSLCLKSYLAYFSDFHVTFPDKLIALVLSLRFGRPSLSSFTICILKIDIFFRAAA